MGTSATASLVCDVHAPANARLWAVEVLRAAKSPDHDLEASLQLVISELVTNALRAGCTTLSVSLTFQQGRLRCAVQDNAPGRPVQQEAAPTDTHGRGLAIVTSLSRTWGIAPIPAGKEVWAELAAR